MAMPLLQSIASADARQTRTSSKSWCESFANWVGRPLQIASDSESWTNAETGPSQMNGTATAGPDQQISTLCNNNETVQRQNLHEQLLEVTSELRRIKEELNEAKDANGKLRMEKAELERKNNRSGGSRHLLLQLPRNSKTKQPKSQNPNLIEDLWVLEVKNDDLRMTNNDLESRITSILKELQQVRDENAILRHAQQHSEEMTEIYRRDLYQIRRRIITEKTARVLGKRYGQSKGRRESFHHWSRRVKYPDWECISDVATRVIKQGNKVAHEATRAELQAAIDSRWRDVEEEGCSEEAEVLQKMFNIIDEGEIDDNDDGNDDDDDDDGFWS